MRNLTIPIAVTLCIVFLLVFADTPIVIADTPTSPPTDKSKEEKDLDCMEDCMILDSLEDFEIPPNISAFLPIFFEFDEFQLSDNNKGKLEELVYYLKLKPNLKI